MAADGKQGVMLQHGSIQATNVIVDVPVADPHATQQQQQWLFNERSNRTAPHISIGADWAFMVQKLCHNVLQDFGTAWTNLTEKAGGKVAAFWDFDWGAALTHSDPSRTIDDEVIFATVYEESSAMKGPYPGWDKDLHFVRSDDLWDTQHTKLVACGNQFEVVGQRVRALADCAAGSCCTKHTLSCDGLHATISRMYDHCSRCLLLYLASQETVLIC